MTRDEIAKMLYMVRAAYPRQYKDFGEAEMKNMLDAWTMVFADKDAEMAFKGVQVYLSSDTKGFAPSPGQIIDAMHKLKPEKTLNEMQAWLMVQKAVKNANYNSGAEFEKLPQVIKRVVRNPATLREWAQMDESEFQTIIQSNFMRSFRAEQQREIDNQKIPQRIRPLLEEIESFLPQIEAKDYHERTTSPDEDIEAMIKRLREA